jgi:hypothetical protein
VAGDEETRQLLTEILRLQREASRKRWKLLLIIASISALISAIGASIAVALQMLCN